MMHQNKKIQEWHLDTELLQKLIQNGSDISIILQDYIKKTDILSPSQIDPSILNAVNNQIVAINNLLEQYRKTEIAIEKYDLSAALQVEIDNLKTAIDGFTEYISGQPTNFNQFISSAIETALDNSSKFNDVKQEIIAIVMNSINTLQNNLNALQSDLNEVNTSLETHEQTADTIYRKNDVNIRLEDLNETLQETINQHTTDISELQIKQQNITGIPGQTVMIGTSLQPIAKNIVANIYIVNNSQELAEAKNILASPILFYPTQTEYTLENVEKWNHNCTVSTISEVTYADTILSTANIKTSQANIILKNNILSAQSIASVDYGYISFGFYGTKIKFDILFDNVDTKTILFFLDSQPNIVTLYKQDEETQGTIYINQLSEGPHTIKLYVDTNGLKIINTIGIDESYAGILEISDIQEDDFFEAPRWEGNNYYPVLTQSYAFTASDNVRQIDLTNYDSDFFYSKDYEGCFIYSPLKKKIYYMINGKPILLMESINAINGE